MIAVVAIAVLFVFFVGAFIYCGWYLASSRLNLVDYFLGLNRLFYKSSDWQDQVFTESVKRAGDKFCLLGCIISVAVLIFGVAWFRKFYKNEATLVIKISRSEMVQAGSLLVICFLLWGWGMIHIKESYDEVFSAVNCAGIHPFQCFSYYMLPNNHIGFNLANHFLSLGYFDKVVTGRILSFFAFWGLGMLLVAHFGRILKSSLVGFAATIGVLMVFPVWGFSFQARGYEWYYFMSVLAYVSLLNFFRTGGERWLWGYGIAGFIGFALIPTFFYLYLALVVYGSVVLFGSRKQFVGFLSCNALVLACTYVFYLPALTFSGTGLLFENKYVTPFGDFQRILSLCVPYVQEYATYSYTAIGSEYWITNDLLFLLPLLSVFAWKNKGLQKTGLFFFVQWVVLFSVVVYMRRFPFMRNTGGQIALSVVVMFQFVYALLERFGNLIKMRRYFIDGLYITLIALLCCHYWIANTAFFYERIYNYPTNIRRDAITNIMSMFPPEAKIALSDESFFWYYEFKKEHRDIVRDINGKEDYFIKQADEPTPDIIKISDWQLIKKIDVYEIYQRLNPTK